MTKARDLGDNAQNTKPKVVNAKGDLIVGTGSDAADRLAVGSNGDTLVADSGTTTGLRWQGSQAAGKNIVINGGFDIWQRGTSFTDNTSYSADRWAPHRSGFATGCSVSRQTITPSDVGGSARYAMQFGRASGNTSTAAIFNVQPIESAIFTQYAGQTVTLSLWVRAGANYSGGSTIGLTLFSGTADFTVGGGGGTTTAFAGTSPTITTSWTRVTLTGTVPSTGVGGLVQIAYTPSGTAGANDWVQITGVQYELGNVATTFTRAGGTLAGELAACQRYYQRIVASGKAYGCMIPSGYVTASTNADIFLTLGTPLRANPTSVDFSSLRIVDVNVNTFPVTNLTFSGDTHRFVVALNATISGATAGRWCFLQANNNGDAFVGFSAEL